MPATGKRVFPFAFEGRYRRPARLFGITVATATVTVDGVSLTARFGPWRVSTPLSNIARATVTGPYRWYTTAGPARLTPSDRGLTFATNSHHGVQLDFHEPVAGIEPTARLRHPNLTVTVTDYRGLVAYLGPFADQP